MKSNVDKEIFELENRGSLLDLIENIVLFNYARKENLRELDKTLRESYCNDLRDFRSQFNIIYESILNKELSGFFEYMRDILILFDRLIGKIEHSFYGYTPIFERKKKINVNELRIILNHDKDLNSNVEEIKLIIERVYEESENEDFEKVKNQIEELRKKMMVLEKKWNERERLFMPFNNK